LIVRALLMPSIATLLGRWFWWPQRVHTHAASQPPANSAARGPAAEATTQPLGPGAMNPKGQQ
jgi:putative drug exporter of the RND superfamily